MSTSPQTQNHALAERFITQALAQGNESVFRELVAANVVVHSSL